MTLFNSFLIVDWSASARPGKGKDSIWLAHVNDVKKWTDICTSNPPTRNAAIAQIRQVIEALSSEQKLFVGLDFGFGYPAGATKKIAGRASWREVWKFLQQQFPTLNENRFEIAGRINHELFGTSGPFWRHPGKDPEKKQKDGTYPDTDPRYRYLPFRKPDFGKLGVKERRHCEISIPRAKSNWELLNPGSVGSQSLLGIAALSALISQDGIRENCCVWPFDTQFTVKDFKQITFAEIYPSAFTLAFDYDNDDSENPLDKAQVKTLAAGFAALDQEDSFEKLLEQPPSLSAKELDDVLNEEGWIVGVSNQFDLLRNAIGNQKPK